MEPGKRQCHPWPCQCTLCHEGKGYCRVLENELLCSFTLSTINRSSRVLSRKPSTHGLTRRRSRADSTHLRRSPDSQCMARTRLHTCPTRFVFWSGSKEMDSTSQFTQLGLHRISNPDPNNFAVSLHRECYFPLHKLLLTLYSLHPSPCCYIWLLPLRRMHRKGKTYQASQFLLSQGSTGQLWTVLQLSRLFYVDDTPVGPVLGSFGVLWCYSIFSLLPSQSWQVLALLILSVRHRPFIFTAGSLFSPLVLVLLITYKLCRNSWKNEKLNSRS